MALSDTARRVLAGAAQHPLHLAAPPDKLPAAVVRAVLNSLLKQGYVEECAAPMEYIGLGWRKQDGARPAICVADAGVVTTGGAPNATTAVDDAEQETAQRTLQSGTDLSAPESDDDPVTQAVSQ